MYPATTSKTGFSIHTEAYHGPFELVLDLIHARKLLVNDLALAAITEEFIEHVRTQDVFPIDETATFVQIAATLILIKSKSLIPDMTLTEEEQGDVDDLKRRLAAYEQVRAAASELGRIFGASPLYPAGERAPEPVFAPARDCTPETLATALTKALAARKEVEKLPERRVAPAISLEEAMDNLSKRIRSAMTLSFKSFTGAGAKERVAVIVSFLALLELVKQGAISAEQAEPHGDITMRHAAPEALPRY
jgi:segregation and condensation protein A